MPDSFLKNARKGYKIMQGIIRILAFAFTLNCSLLNYCSISLPAKCSIRAKITIDNDGNYFGSFKLANHSELRTLNNEKFFYHLKSKKGSYEFRTFIDPTKVPQGFNVMFSAVHKKAIDDCKRAPETAFKITKNKRTFIEFYTVTNHFGD